MAPTRLAVDIAKRDLAFCIGTKKISVTAMAGLGHQLPKFRWESWIGAGINSGVFIAGIAEHDALVACAFIFIGSGIDPHGNVR